VDALTVGYRQAILDSGGELQAEMATFDPAVFAESGVFGVPTVHVFPNHQQLDREGLIGRARSASFVPKDGDKGALIRTLLSDLHAKYRDANGYVTLVYETEVFCAPRLTA
jgi:hypothetical protein